MKCKKCGNQEIDEAKFCGQCGTPFSAVISDSSSDEGAENNEWAIRDCVYDWLSDGAGLIFGTFELEESRDEDDKKTTFTVKLSGTPSQFTEEGDAWETIEVDGKPNERIIQKKTVDDGRKLIVYIETVESKEEWQGLGQVAIYAYIALPLDPAAYERACIKATKWNRGGIAYIQCFVDEESVILRAKSMALLNKGQRTYLLDRMATDCLSLGYESWKDFEELSEHSVDDADDLMESGVEKVSNFSNEDGLQEVVQRMIAEGAKKTALAEYIYNSMPDSSRAEVIERFINLAKLTPAGAATYYSNLKKQNNVDIYGLDVNDEFYKLLNNFKQVSDEGSVYVKPCTYALMTWWKVELGNKDTIDIRNESNNATLQFESSIAGSSKKQLSLTEDERITIQNIIEVSEESKLISYFGYLPKIIPTNLFKIIDARLKEYNRSLPPYGYVAIWNKESDGTGENYLRFRASTYLDGIKVGKVEAVSNMVATAQTNFYLTLFELANTVVIKNWLID